MKKVLLIGLLLLTACERKHNGLSTIAGHNTISTTERIYLMMGQSNMAFMPSTAIANNMASGANVYNCAVGGTSIDEWQKGQPLYEAAVKVYKDHKYLGPISGVFFWQGEREAGSGTQADRDAWPQKFTQMVNDLRHDLQSPDLRVVFMQIGLDPVAYPNTQDMKDKQASVYMHNVIMTKSDDYVTDDGVHFGSSYAALGQRMAVAMLDGD